jgi:hypothetical protein
MTKVSTWGGQILTNEVHDYQMKNDMSKDEISKSSFWTDPNKVLLILRIDLKSEAHWNREIELIIILSWK